MEQPPVEGTDQFDEWMDDIFADEVWVPEDIFENQQNYTTNYFLSIPRIDMEVPTPDNVSLDPPVATDMQVEEDEARADVNSNTEE